jgi:peptide-N4-(N-acetyl-beta-glucosaminyl)asparagine amidase
VFAFGDDGVKDVTERYTKAFDVVLGRRNLASENWVAGAMISATFSIRAKFSPSMQAEFVERDKLEEEDIVKNRSAVTSALPPRQSGSIDWRVARGEMG